MSAVPEEAVDSGFKNLVQTAMDLHSEYFEWFERVDRLFWWMGTYSQYLAPLFLQK